MATCSVQEMTIILSTNLHLYDSIIYCDVKDKNIGKEKYLLQFKRRSSKEIDDFHIPYYVQLCLTEDNNYVSLCHTEIH